MGGTDPLLPDGQQVDPVEGEGRPSPPTGDVERPRTFTVSYDQLPPGVCHKIELVVVGSFAGFVEPRRPTQPGDVDNVTWWIEVVSADFPVIEDACQ